MCCASRRRHARSSTRLRTGRSTNSRSTPRLLASTTSTRVAITRQRFHRTRNRRIAAQTLACEVAIISPMGAFAKQFGERMGAMFRALPRKAMALQVLSSDGRLARRGRRQCAISDAGKRRAYLRPMSRCWARVKPLATGFIEGLPLQKDGGVIVNAGMQAALMALAPPAISCAVPAARKRRAVADEEHWRVSAATRAHRGAKHVRCAQPFGGGAVS